MGKPIIVYAEDYDELRVNLTELLSDKYDVRAYPNGKEALDAVIKLVVEEGQKPLLLTDLQMPVMDGIELVKGLAAAGISIPTVMLSSDHDAEEQLAKQQAGVDMHVVKGSRQAMIEAAIGAAFRKHEARQTAALFTDRPQAPQTSIRE